MDKLEKVISSIKKCNNNVPGRCDKCPYKGKDTHDCVGELLNDTLELLKEKQPKNIKDFQYVADLFIGKCPSCGKGLNNEVYPSFCGFCGQRISWKNSEKK